MVLSCVSNHLCIGDVGDTGAGAGAGAATASDTDSEGSYDSHLHVVMMCFEIMATVRLSSYCHRIFSWPSCYKTWH